MVSPYAVATKIYAVAGRLHRALVVELEPEVCEQKLGDILPVALELFFIVADDDDIVHIANISPYAQLVFRELVNLVQIKVREHLRCEVPDRHTRTVNPLASRKVKAKWAALAVAVDYLPQQDQQVTVFEYPLQYAHEPFVVDAVEVFRHIEF